MVSSRNPSAHRSPHRWGAAAVLVAALLAGCKEPDEISTYKAPRIEYPKARMLAAIIPRGEQSWFFKLQGTPDEVAPHAQAFETFIKSVRMKDNEPTWTLPEGWREAKGRGGRFATLLLGAKDAPVEMSVMNLGGSVLDNVNRWRGQLGLGRVTQDELPKTTKEVKMDDLTATLVDITGDMPIATGKRK